MKTKLLILFMVLSTLNTLAAVLSTHELTHSIKGNSYQCTELYYCESHNKYTRYFKCSGNTGDDDCYFEGRMAVPTPPPPSTPISLPTILTYQESTLQKRERRNS